MDQLPVRPDCTEASTPAVNRPPIVTLCGSTRFTAQLAEANLRLTVAGKIVLAPGCDLKTMHELWDTEAKREALKPALDELHRAKIRLADEVVIVSDATGYIGDSTRAELAYARQLGTPVTRWNLPGEPVPDDADVDLLFLLDDLDIAAAGGCPACDTEPDQMCAACGLCRCERHDACTRPAPEAA